MSVRPSIRPSDRVEQPGTLWIDFNEIWLLRGFRKSIEKTQASSNSDNDYGYFT
jgi:hypothetical protein